MIYISVENILKLLHDKDSLIGLKKVWHIYYESSTAMETEHKAMNRKDPNHFHCKVYIVMYHKCMLPKYT